MLMAATAAMTSASSPVISLVRSDVRLGQSRSDCHRGAVAEPAPGAVIPHAPYEDGSRSTYPTPRRVWISLGSLVSTLRRSTDT